MFPDISDSQFVDRWKEIVEGVRQLARQHKTEFIESLLAALPAGDPEEEDEDIDGDSQQDIQGGFDKCILQKLLHYLVQHISCGGDGQDYSKKVTLN